MKYLPLLITLLSINSAELNAQDTEKRINVIIVVDERIAIGSLSHFVLKAKISKEECEMPITYYPGDMIVTGSEFQRLNSPETKHIFLQFTYSEFKGEDQETYNYNIELKKEWLNENYLVLYIYNLSKKKYRKKFHLIKNDNKKYIFELDSPKYSFRYVINS